MSFQKLKAVYGESGPQTLYQVETFECLRLVFNSDGSRNKQIDTRIGEANVVSA